MFPADTRVTGLINYNDDSSYIKENTDVKWCHDNNLLLDANQTYSRQSLLSCEAQLASHRLCISKNKAIVTISHLLQVLRAIYLVQIF